MILEALMRVRGLDLNDARLNQTMGRFEPVHSEAFADIKRCLEKQCIINQVK